MKHFKIISLIFILALLLFIKCGRDRKYGVIDFGQDVTQSGDILNGSRIYRFEKFRRNGSSKDLFNYIYFKGDTLCFSLTSEVDVSDMKINAWFGNPKSKKYYSVERLDVYENTIFGFSLIGSLMDKFYEEKLNDPIPEGQYCCHKIYYTLKLQINDVFYEQENYFIIQYK